jgi:hypothetical protein
MPTRGATTRLAFQHSVTSRALVEEIYSSHFDRHLPVITIEQQTNYLSFDGDDWLESIDRH